MGSQIWSRAMIWTQDLQRETEVSQATSWFYLPPKHLQYLKNRNSNTKFLYNFITGKMQLHFHSIGFCGFPLASLAAFTLEVQFVFSDVYRLPPHPPPRAASPPRVALFALRVVSCHGSMEVHLLLCPIPRGLWGRWGSHGEASSPCLIFKTSEAEKTRSPQSSRTEVSEAQHELRANSSRAKVGLH